ncbi:phosphate signaling complex protein PhoU [Kushneria aurantia]|uniref:Phosphate-specific transport system accessory protein PhoU n=1 Tax=Kushneria aurantia TaxID=504092 RepID=A0ABV6G0K0_9GAMM|nr:phosphate signaling complex protein PhoU [Kushneria aurantia]
MDITNDRHTQHISRQFNEELESLRTRLLAMGGLVERHLSEVVEALIENDATAAEQVRANDHAVNDFQLELDEACTHVLARRQPTASDLRLVLAVTRTTSDLERMGDESNKIARNVLHLIENGQSSRGVAEIRNISARVRLMSRNALTAFARMDADTARQVLTEDDEVDQHYRSAMRSLVTFMMEDPRAISPVLNVMWILRSLERVGDHASNIAESVIYLVEGADVRHVGKSSLQRDAEDNL